MRPLTSFQFRILLFLIACLHVVAGTARAQKDDPSRFTPRPSSPAVAIGKTEVRLEIITDPRNPLAIQDWRKSLSRLGVSVRAFAGARDAEPDIREVVRGSLRDVILRARIDRRGRLVFPDRVFEPQQASKLQEWIDELKTYGAQGAPDGKPLWGLNQSQFKAVFAALTEPTRIDLKDRKLDEAVSGLKTGEQYPVRFDSAAREWLQRHPGMGRVRQDVRSLSAGTSLAIMLRDAGLGFRPLRTPTGKLELAVSPIDDLKLPWPVGWDLPDGQSRRQTAPKLFELIPVELDDVLLGDVFDVVRIQTELPLILDLDGIERGAAINWQEARVRYPARRVSWLQVVRGITSPKRMASSLKLDEAGRPFLWISAVGVNGR